MLITGETVEEGGKGIGREREYMGTLHFPFNVSVDLKLLER